MEKLVILLAVISRESIALQMFPLVVEHPKQEVQCALACSVNLECSSYLFQDVKSVENESNQPNKCVLLPSYQYPFHMESNLGYIHRVGIHYSRPITKYSSPKARNVSAMALTMGFNLSIQVGQAFYHFKRTSQAMTAHGAEVHCLTQGGILPMENSNEFIEAMTNLVGDPSTTRFVSLVKEMNPDIAQRDLVWTLGPKEYGENQVPGHPKFANWSKSNFNFRYFVVDPITKTYEPIRLGQTRNNTHCQLLGPNLATGKRTIVSSTFKWYYYKQEYATDGKVFDHRTWHGAITTPIKPDWIAVDLESPYVVHHVIFIGRHKCCGYRTKMVKVWIGLEAPLAGTHLNHELDILCGDYPYQHGDGYLSGVSCSKPALGQFVALENFMWNEAMQIEEIGIFGVVSKDPA